ncbi:MAG: metallophosphoesterase [Thermodesulfobacteriota bacterium]
MPWWASWAIFFIIIFSFYGSGHYYLYSWLNRLISFSPPQRFLLKITLGGLPLFFPLARFLARYDFNFFTYSIALFASLWIGFFFYFLLLALARDLLALFFMLAKQKYFFSPWMGRRQVVLIIGAVLLVNGWSFYEARQISVTRIEIPLRGLPKELDGLKVVQISDVHFGMINGQEKLTQIVRMVNDLSPDIVVITGDLVDESIAHMEEMAIPLSQLRARWGVFAITGNHEFYAGVERTVTIMKEAQVNVLRNEKRTLPGGLQILGIDDPSGSKRLRHPVPEITNLFSTLEPDKPSIFLCHQPIYFAEAAAHRIGLQLSGHTHGGQLFPIILISRLFYPLTPGLHHQEESYLYVSRGVGTWGPPLRLGSPPELVLVKLRSPGIFK